jgi:hypothetical protein
MSEYQYYEFRAIDRPLSEKHLRLDDELIEAAAMANSGKPPSEPSRAELARWIKKLPAADKNAYLLRFLAEEGDLALRAELSRRFREETIPGGVKPASPTNRRTIAQLIAARNALVADKQRKAAKPAARQPTGRERK